jgi:hypothetical protein
LRDLESLLNSIVRASMKMDRVGRVESMSIKPEKFGRYVLLDRIGAGGMAEVCRAGMPGV